MGLTCTDQRQPGWNVPMPKVTPFNVTSCTLPFGNSRVSCGCEKSIDSGELFFGCGVTAISRPPFLYEVRLAQLLNVTNGRNLSTGAHSMSMACRLLWVILTTLYRAR